MAKPSTRVKMAQFLDSFDDKITIDSDKTTHKSIDHVKNSKEVKPSLTPYSTLTRDDLTDDVKGYFDTIQRDGMVIIEDLVSPADLAQLKLDTRIILDRDAKLGDNSFYGVKTKRSYALLNKTSSLLGLLDSKPLNMLVDALFAPNALLSYERIPSSSFSSMLWISNLSFLLFFDPL